MIWPVSQIGEIELSEAIFGIEPTRPVVHEVVKNHWPTAGRAPSSALTRAEVSGGGKKPGARKGTGHAVRAPPGPQWTHGASSYRPQAPDLPLCLNKKVKRLASSPLCPPRPPRNAILVVDGLKLDEVKTKTMKDLPGRRRRGQVRVITPEWRRKWSCPPEHPGVVTTTAKILKLYTSSTPSKLVPSTRLPWRSSRSVWRDGEHCMISSSAPSSLSSPWSRPR